MGRGLQRLLLAALLMIAGLSLRGQQYPQWQQYLFNHQSVNPAYTALGENLGFFILSRTQLSGISPANYSTILSFHTPIFNHFNGAGIDAIADRNDSISHLSLFADYSYEMIIDEDLRLRLGGTFGFSRIGKTNEKTEHQGNFGIGAFIYSTNGFFSFSVPRLIRNNAAYENQEERILRENRLIFFSAAAVFPLTENVRFKPQLFYAIPFGRASRMELSMNFLLKEKDWLGVLYAPGHRIGMLAQKQWSGKVRTAISSDIGIADTPGKRPFLVELSMNYAFDFYKRQQRPVFHF